MIESCMEAADFIANPTVDEILETEAAAYEHIAGKGGKVLHEDYYRNSDIQSDYYFS